MHNGLCNFGTWGSLGHLGGLGWAGLTLSVVILVGVLAILALLVVLAVVRARVSAAKASHARGQPTAGGENTAKETLQAQYARGEITRQQYELRKQEVG